MHTKSRLTLPIAAILAACVSSAVVLALQSAFSLTVPDIRIPLAVCLLEALLAAILLPIKRGWLALCAIWAVAASVLWYFGGAVEQTLRLISRISYVYDSAYHWGYLPLAEGAWDAGSAGLPLAIWGAVLATAVAGAVSRGSGLALPGLLTIVSVGACFVVTDTVPSQYSLLVLLICWAILLMTSMVRSRNAAQANRLTMLIAIPVAAALTALFLLVPQKDYVSHAPELRERLGGTVAQLETLRGSEIIAGAKSRLADRETKPTLPAQPEEPTTEGPEPLPVWVWVPWIALLLAAVAELQSRIRRSARRRGLHMGMSNSRAVALWEETKRMAKALGEAPPEKLLVLTGKAKFGHQALTPGELRQYEQYYASSAERLREKGFFRVLYSRWILAI